MERGGFADVADYLKTLVRDACKAREKAALEEKLLKGAKSHAREVTSADFEQMRRDFESRHRAKQHTRVKITRGESTAIRST